MKPVAKNWKNTSKKLSQIYVIIINYQNFMLYYVFLKSFARVSTCWDFIYPRGHLYCRVSVSSLTLDARRCAVGRALFNICFSVAFSVWYKRIITSLVSYIWNILLRPILFFKLIINKCSLVTRFILVGLHHLDIVRFYARLKFECSNFYRKIWCFKILSWSN